MYFSGTPDQNFHCFHLFEIKQEGHSGPELIPCTMYTSHISLCDPLEANFGPRGII